jgi:hypothetical protein
MNRIIKILSSIFIALCLIFSINALPVNADSNPGATPSTAPQLPVPPSNFNPLTASAQELQEYGYPSKPIDSVALKQWEDIMSHAKYYKRAILTTSTVTRSGQQGQYNNANWAGWVINSQYNSYGPYTETSAFWQQPSYSGIGDPCFWTGIGGFNNNSQDVIQAGADCRATLQHGPTDYTFWVDDAPMSLFWVSYPTAYPTNELYVDVEYEGGISRAFLENYSLDECTTVIWYTPDYDGTSAEYIHEPVADYYYWTGSTTFSNCYYYGQGIGQFLWSSNYTKAYITYYGIPIASPTTPGPGSIFTINSSSLP